jgi:PAS domain S-box-containing protein
LGKDAFEALLPHFERALAGEKVSYEEEVSFQGIGRRWVSATYTPAFDGAGIVNGWVAVVADITERKLAEEEQRGHAAIVEATDDAIISNTLEGIILSWNQGAQNVFGYTESEAVGRLMTIIVPDELRDEERDILRRVWNGEHIQRYETVRVTKELKRIDVSLTISPISDASGKVVSVCSIARDITELKQAESIVSSFSQRLIQAQEQERAAVARELHDDVIQRVALAVLNLEGMITDLTTSAEVKSEITGVMEQLRELAVDIQALSYRLHSSKLEQLGLRGAAASFCKEVSAKHKVKIEFQSKDVPENLPTEVSLCLFRVMQEALQNSTKHSGSTHFQVSLTGGSDEMQLTVRDSGKGFDPREALHAKGIGLASMKERLKLVNGQLSIQTEPGRGTEIFARVPFRSTMKITGAGG